MERVAKSPAWEEALAEVERICASRHLCESRGLQALLRFVVEHTADGDLHALKEYNIGREVFNRRADYDPRLDPIVRVQASALRKRLDAYYLFEGSASKIRIALPRGGYTAEIRHPESIPEAPVPEPVSDASPASEPEVAPAESRPRPMALKKVTWPAWSLVGGLALLVLAVWGLVRTKSEATTIARAQVECPEVWGHFLKPGKKSLLVFGVPQFFNVEGGYVRDPSVNSPSEIGKSKMFQHWGPNPEHHLRPTYIYTGVGEVKGVVELSRWFWMHGADTSLRTSNEFTTQELEENDVILVSSSRFKTWLDREPLPADFVFVETPTRSVENRAPRADEKKLYRSEQVADARTGYAIVSLWPGKSPERRLLTIRGADTQSTQAAVAFMTSEKHLAEIDRKLASDRSESQSKPCLQIVLRIDIQGERAQGAAYATHHRMPLPKPQ
jgi:hypothetical protein